MKSLVTWVFLPCSRSSLEGSVFRGGSKPQVRWRVIHWVTVFMDHILSLDSRSTKLLSCHVSRFITTTAPFDLSRLMIIAACFLFVISRH